MALRTMCSAQVLGALYHLKVSRLCTPSLSCRPQRCRRERPVAAEAAELPSVASQVCPPAVICFIFVHE